MYLTRRVAIVGIAASAASAAKSQSLVPIRLLVIRKPGLTITNQCVARCIRGRLYDVSDITGFDFNQIVLPAVKVRPPICDTIEQPYRGNRPFVSSIPRGAYRARVRDDVTKPWMNTLDKRWRIELERTSPRTAIQFHYGNDVSWSEGCFIVGTVSSPEHSMTASYCRLENGEAAIAALRRAVTAPGRNPADVMVGVADDAGLFPDLGGAPSCI